MKYNYIGVHKSGKRYEARKQYKKVRKSEVFDTEKEAGRGYDLMCIYFGLDPVNILKRVVK